MSPEQRRIFERVLAAALAAVEPGQAVRRTLRREGGDLVLGDHRLALRDIRRVLVVGAGKASAPMAAAAEEIVAAAGLPVEGIVTVRYGHRVPTRWVTIREAGHPLPDQAGLESTQTIVDLLAGAAAGDLVLCLLSGGGSALLTLPAAGLALDELQRTTDLLLRSGAAIHEINAVRKHLDMVKGGGLARLAAPARVATLVLSDVVGNALDAIASGPTVPDPTTWAEAQAILERYGLWKRLPAAVEERLRAGVAGHLPETPKPGDLLFARTFSLVVGSNAHACEAAARAAAGLGLRTLVLSSYVEGEAREVARVLAAVLREIAARGQPLTRPCCVVAGGETTVTVRGSGVGGRNQELALAAAWPLHDLPDVLLASIGTDGSDGPTDAAGALVDGTTLARAATAGLDPARHLTENDAHPFFDRLDDLVRTGPTRTNVNDLYLLFAF